MASTQGEMKFYKKKNMLGHEKGTFKINLSDSKFEALS